MSPYVTNAGVCIVSGLGLAVVNTGNPPGPDWLTLLLFYLGLLSFVVGCSWLLAEALHGVRR